MARRFVSIGECLIEFVQSGAETFHQGFSGDAYGTARHARRALGPGWRVGCFTATGTDAWSDRMLAAIAAEGIETDHVVRLAGRQPGLRVIDTIDGERRVSCWREGSAGRALADDPEALDAAISSAHALFFSGVTLSILAPDARGQLLSALDRAKARGALVAFDSRLGSALWSDRGALRAVLRAAARVSTVALPTLPDEAELFGEAGAEAVAQRYQADGCPEVVLRSGTDPTTIFLPETRARSPALSAATATDPDRFNGTYLAARMSGVAPDEALRRADVAAGSAAPRSQDALA